MGLFSPKCPVCGGPIQATGYSFPYPQYRCSACIERNRQADEIKELQDRIKKLEEAK